MEPRKGFHVEDDDYDNNHCRHLHNDDHLLSAYCVLGSAPGILHT